MSNNHRPSQPADPYEDLDIPGEFDDLDDDLVDDDTIFDPDDLGADDMELSTGLTTTGLLLDALTQPDLDWEDLALFVKVHFGKAACAELCTSLRRILGG